MKFIEHISKTFKNLSWFMYLMDLVICMWFTIQNQWQWKANWHFYLLLLLYWVYFLLPQYVYSLSKFQANLASLNTAKSMMVWCRTIQVLLALELQQCFCGYWGLYSKNGQGHSPFWERAAEMLRSEICISLRLNILILQV